MPTTAACLGDASLGVWTRGQALAVMSRGRVQAALRRGEWVELWPRVYADAGYEPDATQRAVAAVLGASGSLGPVPFGPAQARRRLLAYACGRTAARVHGLPLVDDDDPATGAREHLLDEVGGWSGGASVRSGDRVMHRRRLTLGADDLVRHGSGLWLTSPVRTLLDCATSVSGPALVCLLDHALHTRLVSARALEVAVASRRWCPGAPALRTAAALADGRSESPAETLTRLLLLPVLPGLVPQVRLADRTGRTVARFDLGDRERRFAVETDGRRGHAGAAMVARDQHRDRTAAELGWHTERCTWFGVRRRPEELVGRVLAAADRHARRPTPAPPR